MIETIDRRILGALEFVDAVTGLPIDAAMKLEVLEAVIVSPLGDRTLDRGKVRMTQNGRGLHVILNAPLFDAYTNAFENPQSPPETHAFPLRLRLAAMEAGPHHLPQEFEVVLPRSLRREASNSVFTPQRITLLRAPHAPAPEGWVILRLSVAAAGSAPPVGLPGVLVRVFRSPRMPGDSPLGEGMTEWRGHVRGEAIVPLAGIQRFRPGSGANVIETQQAVEFEAIRNPAFTGAAGQAPNHTRLASDPDAGFIRAPDPPSGAQLEVLSPPVPVRVRAGREYVVQLAMP